MNSVAYLPQSNLVLCQDIPLTTARLCSAPFPRRSCCVWKVAGHNDMHQFRSYRQGLAAALACL